jgi:hypothetical protein
MAIVLWANALVSASLGAGFVWGALSSPSGVVLYLGCALLGFAFAGWLAWMSHSEARWRVIADRDGVALRTRGRSRFAWAQIELFEVRTLFAEGVIRMEEVDGHIAVMVLRSGERVALRGLRTHAPFGGCVRDDLVERVATLNALLAAGRSRGGEPTVLESRARC